MLGDSTCGKWGRREQYERENKRGVYSEQQGRNDMWCQHEQNGQMQSLLVVVWPKTKAMVITNEGVFSYSICTKLSGEDQSSSGVSANHSPCCVVQWSVPPRVSHCHIGSMLWGLEQQTTITLFLRYGVVEGKAVFSGNLPLIHLSNQCIGTSLVKTHS